MMKKFFLLILTFAYLASSTGATIYIHQCMGKTIAWDLNINSKNSCGGCGINKNIPKKCCNDQVKVLKTDLDQNLPANYFSKIVLSYALLPKTIPADFHFGFQNVKHDSFDRFIFPRNKINYCILYCTFLI